jgi:predicted phosphodiesterase
MNNDYIKFGNGSKKVLLLHGWGFNTQNSWQKFINLNKDNGEFDVLFLSNSQV